MKKILFFLMGISLFANPIYLKTIEVLSNLKHTEYKHYRDGFIVTKDTLFVDCSGFVDFIIKSIDKNLYKKMLQKSQHSCYRVLATDYVYFFKHHAFKEFKTIALVKEIQKGDIIAYKLYNGVFIKKCQNGKIIYLTKCLKNKYHKCIRRQNTGHVFIALSKPKRYKNKWILKVADSTTHLHKNDSRIHNGVGSGYIFLYKNYIQIHRKTIPIYIGRLVE